MDIILFAISYYSLNHFTITYAQAIYHQSSQSRSSLFLQQDTPLTRDHSLCDLIQAASSRSEETKESLAGCQDTTQVFGVELNTHEPGVILNLNDFHALTLHILADERQACLLKVFHHLGVNLVAVTMALGNLRDFGAVQCAQTGPFGALLEDGKMLAQAHGAAHLVLVNLKEKT